MTKQIEIHGQRVEIYSLDDGRTRSSNPRSIVAYGHRCASPSTMMPVDGKPNTVNTGAAAKQMLTKERVSAEQRDYEATLGELKIK